MSGVRESVALGVEETSGVDGMDVSVVPGVKVSGVREPVIIGVEERSGVDVRGVS